MNSPDSQPVIIGSSMTGLVVSRALSNEGVAHVLIGGPEPDESPRLGESMNEGASLACWHLFGTEFRQFYYPKSHISLFNGPTVSMVSVANPNRCLDSLQQRLARPNFSDIDVGPGIVHLDRSRFDRVFYRKVRESTHCTFVENQRVSVDYDRAADRIVSIDLGSDDVVQNPSCVFDATGGFAVVARAAGVKKRGISTEQRVAWTHHWREPTPNPPMLWWLQGTNLLRLDKSTDGIDGIAWLIPLGDTLSVGLSVEAAAHPANTISKEALIQTLDEAFARRGIDYRPLFPNMKPVAEITHDYSVRERAFGRNWLLVGGSFLGIWFPSSAGMSTATIAAFLASRFIKEPERTGKFYETTMRRLLHFHEHIGRMVQGHPFSKQHESVEFWSWWLGSVLVRVSYDLRIVRGTPHSKSARYSLPEWSGNLSMKNHVIELLLGGMLLIRARKPARMDEQANQFGDYFQRVRYYRRNLFKGWRDYVVSKMAK